MNIEKVNLEVGQGKCYLNSEWTYMYIDKIWVYYKSICSYNVQKPPFSQPCWHSPNIAGWLADCWQIALLTFTPFLFQEVFKSVLIYKDNFASSVELLTFAIIDVISKVLSKYLIERKTTE